MGAGDPIQRLVLELARLPGIGERTASRLAFFLLRDAHDRGARMSTSLARDLAEALTIAVESVGLCESCRNLCQGALCSVCRNPERDPTTVCVVEGVLDLRAIEATGVYRGLYHVLHGALAPLDGVGPEELGLDALVERVRGSHLREVIVATSTNVEGDATALYVTELLKPMGVVTSRLASGVPMGGEIEFLDQATLGRALTERRQL